MKISGSARTREVVVEIVFLAGAFADAGYVGILVDEPTRAACLRQKDRRESQAALADTHGSRTRVQVLRRNALIHRHCRGVRVHTESEYVEKKQVHEGGGVALRGGEEAGGWLIGVGTRAGSISGATPDCNS